MGIISMNIHVIGAGGTGTFFLKEISGYLAAFSTNKNRQVSIESLHIYDGDLVEEKNLERQRAFIEDDIGCNKAEVMALVLNERDFSKKIKSNPMGMNHLMWTAHPQYVLPGGVLEEELRMTCSNEVSIIVSCVDNHACRCYLEKLVSKQKNCFYIDTANSESTTGEIFYTAVKNKQRLSLFRSEVFPEIKQDKRMVTELSCEELNNVMPQHIFTNMTSAAQATLAISNLLEHGRFPRGAVFFDTASLSTTYIEYPYVKKSRKKAPLQKGA